MKIAVLFLLVTVSAMSAADLRVGSATVKITPPMGTPMAGYYSARSAEGVHDDLYAKAIVLEQGGEKAAMVACDLISLGRATVEEARRLIENETGIRGSNVLMCATHSHTGPVLVGRSSRDSLDAGPSELARQYAAKLPEWIAESVRLAHSRLLPARTSAAIGREEQLSFNRRYFMKDGTVGWNPGKLNKNIIKPAGPIDPEVTVVYFESIDKKPLVTCVNFAMHPDTTGGLEISADYPYTLSKRLSEYKGSDMLTLFFNGTCGNINHVDVGWADPQKGHAEAARIGTVLAAEVLKTYARLQPVTTGPLRVRREIVRLPLPVIQPGEVEKAKETIALRTSQKTNQPTFLETVNAFKVLDVDARKGEPQEVEVQVIALGDQIAWVSLPGEIFVELGQAIKKASPFPFTILAELANGAIGYIPNKEAYAQGNYEVVSARCAAGSGELLVDAALRMLKELHGGKH